MDCSREAVVPSKTLYLVRHGTSLANEFMQQPGNEWGDPTFCDDPTLRDAPLSPKGRRECEQLAHELSDAPWLDDIELVVVSPLTRCLETFRHGVAPALRSRTPSDTFVVPVVVVPWITERVYTASDTGSPLATLQKEWPDLDWSLVQESWWYTPATDEETNIPEWRPHGQGQRYAVSGEPWSTFEARLALADVWLQQRPETNVLLVTHWGVIRHWTSDEVPNCHVRRLQWKRALVPTS